MDIKEARKQIDSIDTVLVGEFEKRLSLIKEIGKYKDEHHLPLVDEERDASIIAMHRSNCKDESLANYVENYMKTIVSMRWRMPWLTEAMKDVISCDKPWVGANNL